MPLHQAQNLFFYYLKSILMFLVFLGDLFILVGLQTGHAINLDGVEVQPRVLFWIFKVFILKSLHVVFQLPFLWNCNLHHCLVNWADDSVVGLIDVVVCFCWLPLSLLDLLLAKPPLLVSLRFELLIGYLEIVGILTTLLWSLLENFLPENIHILRLLPR